MTWLCLIRPSLDYDRHCIAEHLSTVCLPPIVCPGSSPHSDLHSCTHADLVGYIVGTAFSELMKRARLGLNV